MTTATKTRRAPKPKKRAAPRTPKRTSPPPLPKVVELPARTLLVGWKAARLAASSDADLRPMLAATVIERFPAGIRLISTDSYMLHVVWLGERDDNPEPTAKPVATAVVTDVRGLVPRLLSRPGQRGAFLRFEEHAVHLQFDGGEVVLAHVHGKFPDWRPILRKIESGSIADIALGPQLLQRIATAGRLIGAPGVRFKFSDPNRAVSFTFGPGEVSVSGVVMPIRTESW